MKIFGRFIRTAVFTCATVLISSVVSAAGWVHVAPTRKGVDLIEKCADPNSCYTRFGEIMILQGGESFADEAHKVPDIESFARRDDEKLYLLNSKDPAILNQVFPGVRVVWSGYGMKVLLAGETAAFNLLSKNSDFTRVELLPENQTILSDEIFCKKTSKTEPDEISKFLDLLDMETFFKDLEMMVARKTRYTYVESAQKSIEDCAAIFNELEIPTQQAPFSFGGGQANNLVATVKGTDEENAGQILVVGHLDSTSPNPKVDAPGADDNGSGSAGVIALARMLKKSGLQPAATIKFVLFLGEEQGLYGSKGYVKTLTAEEKKQIKAVLNLDMIGFDAVAPLSIMIETNSFNRPMVEKMQQLAEKYAEFSIRTSFNAWGSDHAPFLQQKIPAVLTIESEYSSNPNYHQVTDLIESINPDLCANILRLNAATMYFYAMGQNP
ncbi:MAG: Zn-dependent exopeptidase M28 [Candidatus Riflebacteria bacterium]